MRWNYRKYLFIFGLVWFASYAFPELVEISSKDTKNDIEQVNEAMNPIDTQSISKLERTLKEKSSDDVTRKLPEILLCQKFATKNVTKESSSKYSEKLEKNMRITKSFSVPEKRERALVKSNKIKKSNIEQTPVDNFYMQFRTKRTQEDDRDYPIKEFAVTLPTKARTVVEPGIIHNVTKLKNTSKFAHGELTVQTFDEAGKLLAGLLEGEKIDNFAFYKDYSDYITKKWAKLDANCFCKIRVWRDKNLPESILNAKTVFYPFGGPDVAYAILLFPNAKNYILVGQEKTGLGQSILNMAFSEGILNNIKKSEKNFFEKGYFVTSEMFSELNNSPLAGVLPIAMLMISKLGYEILEVTNKSPMSNTIKTVKIKFKDTRTNQEKNFYYIRCSLEDKSTHVANLLNFISTLGEFVTFFKSCSYKMHQKGFEKIKSFVLNNSLAILQDDTGIKFDVVDKNTFDYKLFGSYEKPSLEVFHSFKQVSLARAYLKERPEPFDFCIGYIGDMNIKNKNYKNINLQLFIKKIMNDSSVNKGRNNGEN